MISHEHRCIFVHIPKTAGNSVNRVFGVGWEDHKDLQRYFTELPRDVFAGYFKFAIVRNPWDRLLSDYNYQVKKGRARASKLFVYGADGAKRNFAQWVETALTAPGHYEASDWGGAVSPHIHRWSPQVDWISIDGEPRTDYVARLEHLPEDFGAIRRRLDLPPVRLPHRNRRLHWHYSHYYDRATRELVAGYYARDIELFDYEFEHALLRIAFNWPYAHRTEDGAHHGTTGDAQVAGESADGDPCTVSFATPHRPARHSFWQRQPGLAAAAGLAVLLGVFGAASLVTPLAAAASAAPPTEVQQSARRLIVRSAAAPTRNSSDGFFVRARRLGRTMSELNLKLEIVPSATPGAFVTFSTERADDSNAHASAAAPIVSRSGSGPTPRWWLRRNRNHDDD
jgi:hypothetical protein